MAKDYAKATFTMTRAKKLKRSRGRLLLVISVFVVAVSSVSGWYLYQNKAVVFNKENIQIWISELKTLLHHGKSELVINKNTTTDQSKVVSAEPEIHFNFYTELPNVQVKLPATESELAKGTPPVITANAPAKSNQDSVQTKKSLPPSPAESGTGQSDVHSIPVADEPAQSNPSRQASEVEPRYVVQVGAYKSDSTASEMRISILLAGFDVSVIKTKVGDQIVYRIQQGPFNSQASAKAAQKKLQSKGYDGVVQKIS